MVVHTPGVPALGDEETQMRGSRPSSATLSVSGQPGLQETLPQKYS